MRRPVQDDERLHGLMDCNTCLQSPAMSPFQVMKAVLASLAQPASLSKPVAWPKAKSPEAADEAPQPSLPSPPQPSAFKPSATVFLLDPSGWLNLAAAVSASSLAHVSPPYPTLSLHIVLPKCLNLGVVCCCECLNAFLGTHDHASTEPRAKGVRLNYISWHCGPADDHRWR